METGRPAPATYADVAKLIEHAVLQADASEQDVAVACETAKQYGIAAVMVRPCDTDLAVRWMEGSGIPVASVVSYPDGADTTSAKIHATRDLLRRGVKEIDTVINIGKMISRQFQYVEMELAQLAAACHESGAILKVAFENAYLTQDLKVIACRLCKRAGIDFARTSTPFGPSGYSLEDIALMKRLCKDKVALKASGGIRSLEQVLQIYEAGCTRIGTVNTVPILERWKAKLEAAKASESALKAEV